MHSVFGEGWNGNPKYVIKYLLKNSEQPFEVICLTKDTEKLRALLGKTRIKPVKYRTLKYFHYLMTCRIYITNGRSIPSIPFRKEQYILWTWHGEPYKHIGFDVPDFSPVEQKIEKLRISHINKVLSSSQNFSRAFHGAYFVPYESLIPCGMPRNDILINQNMDSLYKEIRDFYGLSPLKKILLYAPTFRGPLLNRTAGNYIFDYFDLQRILNEKFSGEWCIFFRAHPTLKLNVKIQRNMLDVSNYPDMQELLYAADILITDYSSSMWDFSLTFKPCFIFATDIEEYTRDRGFYTPMSKWPFPIARNNEELRENILNFNNEDYVKRVRKHHEEQGSYETGHACETACKLIYDVYNGKEI